MANEQGQGLVSERQDWLPYVTGLRGLAALFVLLHHVQYHTFLTDEGFTPSPIPLLWFGSAAVAFFLVVSGYCLMLPIMQQPKLSPARGWLQFFWRRCKRILPAYYLCIILSLALIEHFAGLDDMEPDPYREGIVLHLLLVHNWTGSDASIDGPMWSIAVEWQIYWLMPVICLLWRYLPAVPLVLVGFILANTPSCLDREPCHGFHLLGAFLLGALAAHIVHRNHRSAEALRRLPWMTITAVVWAVVLFQLHFHYGDGWGHVWQVDAAASVAGATLLVYLGLTRHQPSLLRRLLSTRIPYQLGLISYSLYLIHLPLMMILHHHTRTLPWGPDNALWHFLFLGLLTLMVTLPAACCLYWVAERPFMPNGADVLTLHMPTFRSLWRSLLPPPKSERKPKPPKDATWQQRFMDAVED